MAGAWIFQGNPKYYDVVGAVRVLPRIEWRVRQYKRRIEAGDTAYIWETGGTGFVARAVVSGAPALGYDDDEEEDPFRRSARDLGLELYAPLAITEVFDPPISRAVCLADLILRTLPNLAFPNATNYPVTPEQEATINAVLAGRTK